MPNPQMIVDVLASSLIGITLVNKPAVAAMIPPTVTTEIV